MPANNFRSRRSFLKHSLAATVVPAVLGPGVAPRVFAQAAAQATPKPSPASPNPGFADHGTVKPPLPLPSLTVLRNNGSSGTLQSIAEHHVTALQLMFTTCTTTCPMQGAIFERVQKLLPDMAAHGIQLVSLSVDPKNDNPKALADWLNMFHAGPNWIGAAPTARDLAAVKSFFGAGDNPLDPHSTRTNILDRSGRLVFRTYELPPPEQIAAILRRV